MSIPQTRQDLGVIANDVPEDGKYLIDQILPIVPTEELFSLNWFDTDLELADPLLSGGADPVELTADGRNEILGRNYERGMAAKITRGTRERLRRMSQNSPVDYLKREEALLVAQLKKRIKRGFEKRFITDMTTQLQAGGQTHNCSGLWTADGADPLQNILDAAEAFADTKGLVPTTLAGNKKTIDFLKKSLSTDGTLELAERAIIEGLQDKFPNILGFKVVYTDARYSSSGSNPYILEADNVYLFHVAPDVSMTSSDATFGFRSYTNYEGGSEGWWVRYIEEMEIGGHSRYELYYWGNYHIIDIECCMRLDSDDANGELI